MGALTPSRWVRLRNWLMLYVSVVRRDTAEERLRSSICAMDRWLILLNRSCRIFRVTCPEVSAARLLAYMLVVTDRTAQSTIAPPKRKISRLSPSGMATSMIRARREGMTRSIMAAKNLMQKVRTMAPWWGRR